jgi:hypothetical protein
MEDEKPELNPLPESSDEEEKQEEAPKRTLRPRKKKITYTK